MHLELVVPVICLVFGVGVMLGAHMNDKRLQPQIARLDYLTSGEAGELWLWLEEEQKSLYYSTHRGWQVTNSYDSNNLFFPTPEKAVRVSRAYTIAAKEALNA